MRIELTSLRWQRRALPLSYVREGKQGLLWLRGIDLNDRPLGYEPSALPGCATPPKLWSPRPSGPGKRWFARPRGTGRDVGSGSRIRTGDMLRMKEPGWTASLTR